MSAHERPGKRAPGTPWPPRTGFEARRPARRPRGVVDLVRSAESQRLVWPLGVVPVRVNRQLSSELVSPVRDQQPPRALGFHRTDEPLDDRDTSVLPDGPESVADSRSATPPAERSCDELDSLVGDQV